MGKKIDRLYNKLGLLSPISNDSVKLVVCNEERLHKTLDLDGVVGKKPCINSIMEVIMPRLEREYKKELLARAAEWNCIYDAYDDYSGFDDEDDWKHLSSAKRTRILNKREYKKVNGTRRGGKKNKGKDKHKNSLLYGYYEDYDDEELNSGYKRIVYYSDIENELSAIEFDNIHDFNDFCDKHGFYVPYTDYNNIVNNEVVHCCLDPIDKEYGDYTIITDTSYGALYWTVSEDVTKDKEQSLEGSLSVTN